MARSRSTQMATKHTLQIQIHICSNGCKIDQFFNKIFHFVQIKKAFFIFNEFKLTKNGKNYNSRRLSKPVDVQKAKCLAEKEHGCSFKVFTSRKFKASRLKKQIWSLILVKKK